MSTTPWNTPHITSRALFWLYLLLITCAECVTVVSPQAGLVLHFATLALLLVHAGCGPNANQRHLALALTLAPTTRVVSLALPLERIPQISWYPLLAAPLLMSAACIVRQVGLNRYEHALQPRHIALQLALSMGGFAIGALEYLILRPAPLSVTFSWTHIVLWSAILIVFTGFTEELIFRKIIDQCAVSVYGTRVSLWYVAILFGVLHIGYLSVLDVVFVGLIGALFAQIARWSRSILGVSLCHGVANITLFLLMPYLMTQAPRDVAFGLLAVSFVGALAFVVVVGILSWQASLRTHLEHN